MDRGEERSEGNGAPLHFVMIFQYVLLEFCCNRVKTVVYCVNWDCVECWFYLIWKKSPSGFQFWRRNVDVLLKSEEISERRQ